MKFHLNPPAVCDICAQPIANEFSDAIIWIGASRTWADVCPACAEERGASYGTGRGQRYVKQTDGRFLKVEG